MGPQIILSSETSIEESARIFPLEFKALLNSLGYCSRGVTG